MAQRDVASRSVNADLLAGVGGSYGTLASLTLATVECVRLPTGGTASPPRAALTLEWHTDVDEGVGGGSSLGRAQLGTAALTAALTEMAEPAVNVTGHALPSAKPGGNLSEPVIIDLREKLRVAQLAAARLDEEHANNSRRVRSRMLAPAKPVPAAKCDKTSLSKIGEQACAWGTPPRPPCLRRPGRGLASRRGLFPPPLHEAAGLVAARRRKPSLSRHHASPEAPTVGRRSVVVRDDGTSDASQKLGARGATARETALTSEFTSKTLTFDRSKLRPRRATRAGKRCVRKPRAERTNFPELARELGRRATQ